MTTDKADKVHPVILAMARAMAGYDLGYDAAPASYRIEHAKAAAKVLLEMLPTEAMLIAGSEANPTVWNDETDAGFGLSVANDVYVAMTAAARSEMGLEG